MKAEAFSNYTDVTLTLIGLGLFLGVFVCSVIWVNMKANQNKFKKISSQILDDGEKI